MIEIRNARWLDAEHTGATCTIYAADFGGWIPYTVTAEEAGSDAFAAEVWATLQTVEVEEPQPDPAWLREQRARSLRDSYLKQTDVFMLPDYPITEERRADIMAYREYLRDLPQSSLDWYDQHILTLAEWEQGQRPGGES